MSREEDIIYAKNLRTALNMTNNFSTKTMKALDAAIKALEQEPRKKGHWIMTHDYFTGAYESIDYVECSRCHADSLEEGNYCPNCGAKME